MSVLRKTGCYKTAARLFETSDRVDTLRWFILPDCSPIFPGTHLYGGRPWRKDRQEVIEGPGEFSHTPLVWDAGLPPLGPLVQRGDLDWFLNGIPDSLLPP